jgi:hypothetical protein
MGYRLDDGNLLWESPVLHTLKCIKCGDCIMVPFNFSCIGGLDYTDAILKTYFNIRTISGLWNALLPPCCKTPSRSWCHDTWTTKNYNSYVEEIRNRLTAKMVADKL